MAQSIRSTGDFITVTVAGSKSATAGSLAEMTDDFTARDNETVSGTQVMGVFLTGGSAAAKVTIVTRGVVTLTAGSAGCTAGKTVVVDDAAAQKVEDGTGAGTVIGRALDTASANADVRVLLGQV